MRILNWNIQQGGGTRIPQICRHIADVAPDLVVTSEFRLRNESALRTGLLEAGLKFVVTSGPAPNKRFTRRFEVAADRIAVGGSPGRWRAVARSANP